MAKKKINKIAIFIDAGNLWSSYKEKCVFVKDGNFYFLNAPNVCLSVTYGPFFVTTPNSKTRVK